MLSCCQIFNTPSEGVMQITSNKRSHRNYSVAVHVVVCCWNISFVAKTMRKSIQQSKIMLVLCLLQTFMCCDKKNRLHKTCYQNQTISSFEKNTAFVITETATLHKLLKIQNNSAIGQSRNVAPLFFLCFRGSFRFPLTTTKSS